MNESNDEEIRSMMTSPIDQMSRLQYENRLLSAYIAPRQKGEHQPTVAYRLPALVKEEMEAFCKEEGQTATSFFTRAIINYLIQYRFRGGKR